MKIARKIRKKMARAGLQFISAIRKDDKARFVTNAYYITLNDRLASMTPYRNWHQAYAAAKRFDRRAFITYGLTLNRRLEKDRWIGYKRIWGAQNAVPR